MKIYVKNFVACCFPTFTEIIGINADRNINHNTVHQTILTYTTNTDEVRPGINYYNDLTKRLNVPDQPDIVFTLSENLLKDE